MLMFSQVERLFLLAALGGALPACGSSKATAEGPGAPGDGGTPACVMMGGACIPLGPGAMPCTHMPSTGYDGDTSCIEAPLTDEGMQMHYGPKNYDDPAEMQNFIIPAGQEYVDCMFMKTPNQTDIHMNDFHVRLRPGTHHMITYVQPTVVPDSTKPEACAQGPSFTFLVGATDPSTDINMAGGTPGAPEYAGAAMTIKASSQAAVQMHFINTTDHDRLKEGWINAMYFPADQVTMETNPITWLGGLGDNILPHTHVITQGGSSATTQITKCEVTPDQGDLNIIATVAHMHSHTTRLAAFIQRQGSTERTKFYEDYNWEEPKFVYYNSVTKNPMWDPVGKTTGGLSGDLVAHPGDQLSWECEVNNDSDNLTLKFSDLALTGEMCNVFGVYGPGTAPWNCDSL